MARIFVSYARPTQSQARLIADTLRAGGHEVWIDDQLLAHRSFTDAIEEQLEAADAAIVLWSSAAVGSEWVRAEASRARKAGKLVQVRVERCALPMPYDQMHCIDLTSWSGDYQAQPWRSLLASLGAVTGETRATPPAPRSAAPRTGAGTAGADRRGERRQVTALYCDLADSAALAARLDPEDMMQVLDAYQAACDDVITHHGGSIAKYMSHGVLAYFGYPRGDEDEAANAVRAGLALGQRMRDLDLPPGVTLRPSVGVATGLVVISELIDRGAAGETGIVGQTPGLASQLASIAAPGAVVTADTTRRLTEGLFTFRDLGAAPLPGYEAAQRVFEAIEATDVGSRSQARAHAESTPMFGRDAELAQMVEAWDLAREGDGQVVLVQGEAGIGKSRLVEAFKQHVAATPSTQVTFYCAPNYSDTALHPVSERFARAAGFEHADGAATRREKLGRLLDRYGAAGQGSQAVLADVLGLPPDEAAAPAAGAPERRKAVTLDTLLAMLDPLAAGRPALFIFEDLHWADPTTLELLDRVTRRAADRAWLILGTARPEFEARWSDHADVTHIQLGRLDRRDAERICASLGAEAMAPPDILRHIIARSDGVPLFVEEMTKAVLEAMAADPSEDGGARMAIPNTLHDSLVARLDRLGAARPVASLGAAIGRRFSYELIAAVSTSPPAELRQALRELTKSGLVERSGTPPNSHYLFRHALVRDAAYESLLKREREALHGRIAAVVRDRFPETGQAEPALLAYHLTQSGAIAEAIPMWAEAGQRAAARAAHAEAAVHLRTALDLLRQTPADGERAGRELPLLLGLAASLAASRGFSVPEVATRLAEARAICDSLGNAAGLFAVLNNICNFSIVGGQLAAAEETAWRCIRIAEETGLVTHSIEANRLLGYIQWAKGDLPAARDHLERGITTYRAGHLDLSTLTSPLDPGVVCLTVLPMVLDALGDADGAERTAAELVAHARSLGQPFSLAFALSNHAVRDLMRGQYQRALAFAEEVLVLSEENGFDTYAAGALVLKASAIGRRGEHAQAIEMAARGLAAYNQGGNVHMLAFLEGELAGLQALSGDPAAALATIDRAIAHAHQSGDRFFLSPLHRRRAEILVLLPGADRATVEGALEEAQSIAMAQGAPAFAAEARSLLAEAPH
ncbi:MAG TPA: AAA family ATPase [Caulobacteraceae bacterium]|nr:AAA family ATPase [Caulobacteraceae bacterium]